MQDSRNTSLPDSDSDKKGKEERRPDDGRLTLPLGAIALTVPSMGANSLFEHLDAGDSHGHALLKAKLYLKALFNRTGHRENGGAPYSIPSRHISGPGRLFHSSLVFNTRDHGPGILGHELGHVTGDPPGILSSVRDIAAGIESPIVTAQLAMLLTRNRKLDKGIATASSAVMAPIIAEELRASTRGYNMLRDSGAGRLESAKAFMGIPTYLAPAVAPWLLLKLKDKLRRYDYKDPKYKKRDKHGRRIKH